MPVLFFVALITSISIESNAYSFHFYDAFRCHKTVRHVMIFCHKDNKKKQILFLAYSRRVKKI